jgi:hypothetical protein
MHYPTQYIYCLVFYFVLFSQSKAQEVYLDTACFQNYPLGLENIIDDNLITLNREDVPMGISLNVDTLNKNELPHFKFVLKTDSSKAVFTDTSFTIKNKSYKANKNDYSEFNYYLGYFDAIHMHFVNFIDGRNEVGLLLGIDDLTGKEVWLESLSDYPLSHPSMSLDSTFLSTYTFDLYSSYSFISIFEIVKSKTKFCLRDYCGIMISKGEIIQLDWIEKNTFAIAIVPTVEEGVATDTLLMKIEFSKANTGNNLELDIDTNITEHKITEFLNQLNSDMVLKFWAPSHPELSDPGVDWSVKMINNELYYRLWWHEWLTPWSKIDQKSLLKTIMKYSSRIENLTIQPL